MSKIKQQFSDLRKTTPKHVQWLLLAAAFVVVLILLTLLVGGWGKNKDNMPASDDREMTLKIDPNETLDWAGTPVGEIKTQQYTITATAPVKILNVRTSDETPGLSMAHQCPPELIIDEKTGCRITVKYAPDGPMSTTGVALYVDWRGKGQPDTVKKIAKITMAIGAKATATAQPADVKKTEPQPEPAPIAEPTPIETPVTEPVAEPEQEPESDAAPAPFIEPDPVSAAIPVKQEIRQEIEAIAPSLSEMAPVVTTEPSYAQSETCSDFAFPGYNASGRQIGWIKPERGAYYFHPFSDKNCDSPTGVYNPDNGIISDIKDASKKIGTDAEHIGFAAVTNGALPQLSAAPNKKNRSSSTEPSAPSGQMAFVEMKKVPSEVEYASTGQDTVISTQIYDRSFILRQYKPIPATIVSDVRADATLINGKQFLPVRATVDRNVYADNGRTVIIPTGTLLLGYVDGEVPGPYKSIGRMEIKWYQFVLPNGVEFNFNGSNDPFSGDAQGRVGVPGRGSTDYLEQFVMPMLTAIVPAAVNMIAPVADKFVNQIDLDNNTVVQSGTVRSSELAKNEIITAWNQVAQKLMVDMMDNSVPPFTIPAGTRITVYSPADLQVSCGTPESGKPEKCAVGYGNNQRQLWQHKATAAQDDSWVGQVRSFNAENYCEQKNGLWTAKAECAQGTCGGMDYRNLLFYCQTLNYKAVNNAKQEAVWQNQNSASNTNSISSMGGVGSQTYNEQVLGLKYDDDTGAIINPFQSLPKEEAPAAITCPDDGSAPDANGCCTGEIYTDMGDQGFNCCPETGGDCFPPIL
ncbi:hypothetical protein HDR61_00690 [bacterium]|nr:hypothetical protein [bacterium]